MPNKGDTNEPVHRPFGFVSHLPSLFCGNIEGFLNHETSYCGRHATGGSYQRNRPKYQAKQGLRRLAVNYSAALAPSRQQSLLLRPRNLITAS